MLVMYQCQREARQLPNSSNQEKQIKDVTGKFRYDVLDIFVWSNYVTFFK